MLEDDVDEMTGVAGRQAGRKEGLNRAGVQGLRWTKAEQSGTTLEISVEGKTEKVHEHKGKNAENTKFQHHEITVLDAII